MARAKGEKLTWKVAAIGAVFALLLGVAVAAILYRTPDITQDQTIFPLGIAVSPNPFPSIGLSAGGNQNFTFNLTIINSNQNPNLTLSVFVQPSVATNLSVSHCIENSQANFSTVNKVCADGFQPGNGVYFANVTSGGSVVLKIQALFIGTITEPTSITWRFFAEGTEAP